MKNKIRCFCPMCGKECEVEIIVDGYFDDNGKPKLTYFATCPDIYKMSFFKRLFTEHLNGKVFYRNYFNIKDYPDL